VYAMIFIIIRGSRGVSFPGKVVVEKIEHSLRSLSSQQYHFSTIKI
jgi:hypothetical protein